MSKTEIVKKIANDTGESQKNVANFLEAFLNHVQGEVANGNQVTLVGFGTFYRAFRKATTGRNPKTGEPIQIKASNQAKFRAGKSFKKIVNE
jgi:DNA-binding protein HU-beta